MRKIPIFLAGLILIISAAAKVHLLGTTTPKSMGYFLENHYFPMYIVLWITAAVEAFAGIYALVFPSKLAARLLGYVAAIFIAYRISILVAGFKAPAAAWEIYPNSSV